MRPDNRNDRVLRRFLPWLLLLGIAGIWYWTYAPTPADSASSAPQDTHHTASPDNSLTPHKPATDKTVKKPQPSAPPATEAPPQAETEAPSSAAPAEAPKAHFEKRFVEASGTNLWQQLTQQITNAHLLSQLTPMQDKINAAESVTVLYSAYVEVNGEENPQNMAVLAIRLSQQGTTHYFFAKTSGNRASYYNRDGETPYFTMDRAPFAYSRISSPFNLQRRNPVTHRIRPHLGVDFKGPYGTAIHSTGDGVVTQAGWESGYGRVIYINHANGYQTRYAHLSRILVSAGDTVKRGQVIGRLGNSGASTGSHLHYEVRINGTAHNPMTVTLPTANPIPQHEMSAWQYYADSYKQAIQQHKEVKNG